MKIKVVIDFLEKDSYELVKKIKEITKTKELDIEINAYDYKKTNTINNAYYALAYANRFGIGLDYAYLLLDKLHNTDIDVNEIEELANIYQELSYNRYDMIDAIIDGDFMATHEFMQYNLEKENLNSGINAIIYNDNQEKIVLDNLKDIEEYILK